MFIKILNYIRGADQFGALYKPQIRSKQSQYKTVLGGLLSILVYGISLTYILYEIILWQEGDFLPRISTIKRSLSEFHYDFDKLAVFHLRNHFQQEFIDPFASESLILQPILYKVVDGIPTDPYSLKSESKNLIHQAHEIEIKNLRLVLSEEGNEKNPSIEYLVTFQKCNEQWLLDGQKCASQDEVDKFFAQTANQLVVKNYITNYNTSTKEVEIIEDDFFVAFDQNTVYFSQSVYDVAELSVDNGFLLESWERMELPIEIEHQVQQMDIEYFKKYLGNETYIVFQFEIGVVQEQIRIEFPKISEIMANIGSIVSFFFVISYLALLINESKLEDEIIKTIVEIYYPQIKDVEVKRNFYGSMKEVLYLKKKIDLAKFKIKYEQLCFIAREKLTITNQIYELSRIQFMIQSMKTRDEMKAYHEAGIKLRELEDEKQQKRILNMSEIHNDLEQSIPNSTPLQTIFVANLEDPENEYCKFQFLDDDFSLLVKPETTSNDEVKEEIKYSENSRVENNNPPVDGCNTKDQNGIKELREIII